MSFTVAANLSLVLWTLNLLLLVTLAVRRIRYGRGQALSRPLRLLLAAALLGLIWVYAGFAALAGLAVVASLRRLTPAR